MVMELLGPSVGHLSLELQTYTTSTKLLVNHVLGIMPCPWLRLKVRPARGAPNAVCAGEQHALLPQHADSGSRPHTLCKLYLQWQAAPQSDMLNHLSTRSTCSPERSHQ